MTHSSPHRPVRSSRAAVALLAALAAAACGDVTPASPDAAAPALSRGSGSGADDAGGLSGNKACAGFAVRLADGRVLSGKQKLSLAGVSGDAVVQGRFARFTVDLATFKVTNYALNGTTIFARK